MTTPSTNLGLGAVQTEFGGSNPVAISEYYRGGSLVGSGTAAGTSGQQIATSGTIRLGDFRAVSAITLNDFDSSGGGADISSPYSTSCTITLNTDGTITWSVNSNGNWGVEDTNWATPTTGGVGNSYWVRGTVTSGSPGMTSGTSDTWLQLSSARAWTFSRSTIGTTSGVYTLEIASDSGGSNIITTNTLTISIENGPP
jgi:hypothetical protein